MKKRDLLKILESIGEDEEIFFHELGTVPETEESMGWNYESFREVKPEVVHRNLYKNRGPSYELEAKKSTDPDAPPVMHFVTLELEQDTDRNGVAKKILSGKPNILSHEEKLDIIFGRIKSNPGQHVNDYVMDIIVTTSTMNGRRYIYELEAQGRITIDKHNYTCQPKEQSHD